MIQKLKDHAPQIAAGAYIHESCVIIGNVKIGKNASVWPLASLRGDIAAIEIGENSNIQDCCVVHVNENEPCIIGKDVTVGHGAVIHGAKIGDRCLVGMRAVVMESEIGEDCLIAAGAVVTPGRTIPPRSLVMGMPAKVTRELTEPEVQSLRQANGAYLILSETFKESVHAIV